MDDLKERVRQLLNSGGLRATKIGDLMKALGLPPTEKGTVRRLVRELAAEGHLAKLQKARHASQRGSRTVEGVLRVAARGFGFVVPSDATGGDLAGPEGGGRLGAHDFPEEPNRPKEVFIPKRRMGDALNGDRVRVLVMNCPDSDSEPGRSCEGAILEVLERGTSHIVGTFYGNKKKGGTIVPRDERFNRTIIVPRPDPRLEVVDGMYVVVEIVEWTRPPDPLYGRVQEVIGTQQTPGVEITVIVRDAGVEPEFPEHVSAEAEAHSPDISDEEIARRTDFRGIPTFTMDGATAKDFDDALSIERIPGGWRLGVHIADVSHYVTEGSSLDQEAYERATSIYPVDRVVPMLPEKLSNDLCSLRPRVDRLVMSCVMDIDGQGRVHNYSVHEGIIRSAHRLIYEDVQAVMDGRAQPALARELGDIRMQLEDLYQLRAILTEMRMRRGALDLDLPETEVVFAGDEARMEGTPEEGAQIKPSIPASELLRLERPVIGLVRRPRLESHRVVEECMLIANEVVASHLFNLGVPSVYRVHEPPDDFKLRQIMPVLSQLGVRFPGKKSITPDAIQSALDMAAELDTGVIARRLILRSMMRARYADENLGHYGLGSLCYTHFTSPIRRYPDLLVHRILRETIQAGAPTTGRYAPPGEDDFESRRATLGTRDNSTDVDSFDPGMPDPDEANADGLAISDKIVERPRRRHREETQLPIEELNADAPAIPVRKSPGRSRREATAPAPGQSTPGIASLSGLTPRRLEHYRRYLGPATAHCSERERRSEEIENDATKLKALEFMRTKLGDEFDGMITGVLSAGFFVELTELPVDGMVHVRTLKGDYFEFDEDRMLLVGRSTGESFKLGDKVRIAIENVDVAQLQMDFVLVKKMTGEGSLERRAELNRVRQDRAHRHAERRPRHGGFQARGKRRKGRR